jgi:multidrug efflux system membrane fusion protein
MPQFRLAHLFETAPSAVQGVPAILQRNSARVRLILSALGVVGLLLFIRYLTAPAGGPHHRPAPPVRVATAAQKTVNVIAHTIGSVVANATVNVTSQVNGQVAEAEFQEGQIVHKGDVLFRLDPRPFQAAIDQAEANLARDRAQLVNARHDRRRYNKLFRQNAISAQQRDRAIAQAGALAGSVKADEAALALAKLNLDYSVIRAPVDGKTGPIKIQPGNLVKANDTNPLVVITQIKPIKVSFSLPQTDLPRIQAQMAAHKLVATVRVHGNGGATLRAPVDFVDNAVNAQTGTIQLRATFPNTDGRLVPGELVDVSVALNELHNAVVVPSEAVNVGPNGHYVYVVNDRNVAEMDDVTILYDDGTEAAVKGKVHAGDKVITAGQLRAEPGRPVAIAGAPQDGTGSAQP